MILLSRRPFFALSSYVVELAVLDEKLLSIEDRIKQLKEMKKMISQFKKDIVQNDC